MKKAKENRDKVLHVRVTEAQHDAFVAYFKRNRTSISDGIRQTISLHIKEAEKV
jgi:hypothetical protein